MTSNHPRIGLCAAYAGRAVGVVLRSVMVRSAPGVVGAIAVSVGLGEIYRPLLLLSAGVFLLVIDRRSA